MVSKVIHSPEKKLIYNTSSSSVPLIFTKKLVKTNLVGNEPLVSISSFLIGLFGFFLYMEHSSIDL